MSCEITLSLTSDIFLPLPFGVFLLRLCEFLLGFANKCFKSSIFIYIEEFDDGFFLVAFLEGMH